MTRSPSRSAKLRRIASQTRIILDEGNERHRRHRL
jgi:hypothetical protein